MIDPERRCEIKKTSIKLEKQLAAYLGALRVPGSGSIKGFKGDIIWNKILIDSKNTEKTSIKLKKSDLIKIKKESSSIGFLGHLILSFLVDDIHYAVIPVGDWPGQIEKIKTLEVTESSKTISKFVLSSTMTAARRSGGTPLLLVNFQIMALGVPKQWLILPLQLYKETFSDFGDC